MPSRLYAPQPNQKPPPILPTDQSWVFKTGTDPSVNRAPNVPCRSRAPPPNQNSPPPAAPPLPHPYHSSSSSSSSPHRAVPPPQPMPAQRSRPPPPPRQLPANRRSWGVPVRSRSWAALQADAR
eukprot:1156491-Pelagomonas_calceolata.AAC.1